MASSKSWPYTISMNKSKKLRPGEKVFSFILIIFSAILFFESYKISGFSGLTTRVHRCLKKGLLLFWLLWEKNAIRISPPLNISEQEIIAGCKIICQTLDEL